jgi:hypothetical protein
MYPNPTNDLFFIRMNAATTTKVKAVNMLGQVIFEKEYNLNTPNIEVNAQSWETGTYMITVSQDGNTQTQKLVKQ